MMVENMINHFFYVTETEFVKPFLKKRKDHGFWQIKFEKYEKFMFN